MEKKHVKQRMSAVLLLCCLFSVSCGSADSEISENTDTQISLDSTAVTEEVTGRESLSDDLPDRNYDGADFVILDRTAYNYEFEADTENGDLLNDAVYQRNLCVEDRFNVNIVSYAIDGSWYDPAVAFNNKLKSSIMAGDGSFDLVAGYAAMIPQLVSEGIFANWNELEYNDFSKPWWSEKVAEEMTINGKMYLVTGDISIALWENMSCFLFNKNETEARQLDDMYALVRDGKWTFDKMISLSKGYYQDLDGDNEKSEGDAYGLILGSSTTVDHFKEAFEIPVTEKGSDGFPVMALKNEKMINTLQIMDSFVYTNDVYFVKDLSMSILENIYRQGNSLFIASTLKASVRLRDMNDDFGIIPYPLYDENQSNYHSTSMDEFSLFVIPADAKDKEMTSIITEALCAESYKNVIPTYYDIVLKTKASRDDESAEMIDIIRDGLIFDWGYVHSMALGRPGHLFAIMLKDRNTNLVSEYDKNVNTYEKNLEKLTEIYR